MQIITLIYHLITSHRLGSQPNSIECGNMNNLMFFDALCNKSILDLPTNLKLFISLSSYFQLVYNLIFCFMKYKTDTGIIGV